MQYVFEGIPELQAAMKDGHRQLIEDERRAAAHAAQVTTRTMKQDAPKRSGRLRDSIRPVLRNNAQGASGYVRAGASYASYVRDGTVPHTIRPVKRAALAFSVGGTLVAGPSGAKLHQQVVFTRRVNHPGTKPNDFVTAAVNEGQGVIVHDTMRALEKLKARIEG